MIIEPINEAGDHATGGIFGVTVANITKALGFKSNCKDDPSKVVNSWGFTADGKRCGIWDYKGSQKYKSFSTFGPREVFVELFGADHVE